MNKLIGMVETDGVEISCEVMFRTAWNYSEKHEDTSGQKASEQRLEPETSRRGINVAH